MSSFAGERRKMESETNALVITCADFIQLPLFHSEQRRGLGRGGVFEFGNPLPRPLSRSCVADEGLFELCFVEWSCSGSR